MNVLDVIRGAICQCEMSRITELERIAIELSDRSQLLESKLRQEISARGLAVEKMKLCLEKAGKSELELISNISHLETYIQQLERAISDRDEFIKMSKDSLSSFSNVSSEAINSYWHKYATADIRYKGRFIGNSKRVFQLDVKTLCLEGQNDEAIIERVRNAKAFVYDIMAEKKCSFHKACDISIMRVAEAFQCFYHTDMQTWATSEFWMFPSETEAYGKGDCDDMATWRYAGWRIAGIPEKILRVAVGITYGNVAHSTNYYFGSDLKWHHVNSTSNFMKNGDVCGLKTTNDPTDSMAIRDVWFSFTESRAWYELSVTAAESLSGSTRIKKEFVIKGD